MMLHPQGSKRPQMCPYPQAKRTSRQLSHWLQLGLLPSLFTLMFWCWTSPAFPGTRASESCQESYQFAITIFFSFPFEFLSTANCENTTRGANQAALKLAPVCLVWGSSQSERAGALRCYWDHLAKYMCLSSPGPCSWPGLLPAGLPPLSFLSAWIPGCAWGEALSKDHMTAGKVLKSRCFSFKMHGVLRENLGWGIKYLSGS